MSNSEKQLAGARERMLAQRSEARAVFFSTQNEDDTPEASHAPSLYIDHSFWLLLSTMSAHTRNIRRTGQLSIMVVDMVDKTGNPFARRRQSMLCESKALALDSAVGDKILEKFTERFGETVSLMRQLSDFDLYRLKMIRGRYIEGFGQAYTLSGAALDELTHIGPEQLKPMPQA